MKAKTANTQGRVLVVGVYLAGHATNVSHIVREFAQSRLHRVEQSWAAIGGSPPCGVTERVTVTRVKAKVPKFVLINRLLARTVLDRFDYVVVCDDDVALPSGFLDEFLTLQARYDFALAQPARTHDSYLDHPIVEQVDGLLARRTRFVEIGPLFCMRRDIVPLLVPFDMQAPMGWGLDFIWPITAEKNNLRLGIIDAVPLGHTMRKPMETYDSGETRRKMEAYLDERARLTPDEAFKVLEEYPCDGVELEFNR